MYPKSGNSSASSNVADPHPHRPNNPSNGNGNGNGNGIGHGNGSCRRPELIITPEVRQHIDLLRQVAYEFFDEARKEYGDNELIFCFNGGKDCTVLLDLLMRYYREHGISSDAIPMLYIDSDDSFEEIDEFVVECVNKYNVKLIKYKDSLKVALTHMTQDMPDIKAVFVGSRSTDPYCQHLQRMQVSSRVLSSLSFVYLQFHALLQRTDKDWPDIMRLNPLLDWNYHDIWYYIHIYNVPYCTLYARGYTSIGYRSNTLPNPHLKCDTCCVSQHPGDECFKPAWELQDASQERAGRVARQ